MNVTRFGSYKVLSSTLSEELKLLFIKGVTSDKLLQEANHARLIYSVFIDISSNHPEYVNNYTGLNVLNCEDTLNKQYRLVIGFIYSSFDYSNESKYAKSKAIERFYCNVASQANFTFSLIKISKSTQSKDVDKYAELYKKKNINNIKLEFYRGWRVESKEGDLHNLNLENIYTHYGIQFTNKIHQSFIKYAYTKNPKTLTIIILHLHKLLANLTGIMPTQEAFTQGMSCENSHIMITLVYNSQLLKAKSNNLCIKTFHQMWRATVTFIYDFFIGYDLIEEPLLPFIVPEFKSSNYSRGHSNTKTVGTFNKLMTPIPLSYTDTQSKEAIFEDIKKDIAHIVYCAEKGVEEIMIRFKRYEVESKIGDVKDPDNTVKLIGEKGRAGGSYNPVSVGKDNSENVCATFNKYRFDIPVKKFGYSKFLGYYGYTNELSDLLCLPTNVVLYPFLILLVREHPLITPSWLTSWQLYDEKGCQLGFKQSKKQWIAISNKKRKGFKKAEQQIILSEKAKYLVECIIKLTQLSRDYLKLQGDDDYKYMLLTSRPESKPKRVKSFIELGDNGAPLAMKTMFTLASFKDGNSIRSIEEAEKIAQTFTIRKLRDSVGINVYFETQSVHAMAEALGHARYDPKLISRYLPKVLWDYFTNRWVRLFQNAIVYEAMKDSDYLFDAVDFTENELDQFITNHGLGDLPLHILTGKKKAKNIVNNDICSLSDVAVYTLSTALLQVFMALIKLVNECGDNKSLTHTAQKWFESAMFVISHLELCATGYNKRTESSRMVLSEDINDMYKAAKEKPLDIESIRGVIIC